MPKAILEFNLPDEQHEYNVVTQASRVQSFVWDFSQQLRAWDKYHHDFKDADDALDKIREEFYRLLNEHNVEID
jgi:coproporphyrinogen III oxidase-like Fe-S oxidoreductase